MTALSGFLAVVSFPFILAALVTFVDALQRRNVSLAVEALLAVILGLCAAYVWSSLFLEAVR